ncbi:MULTISPECIES: hypothetical protein [unclassified Rhizobium]|uniref:hypothetical protein n=1 Tax=unclassified Rhizobium TaxID=2613769 RepID=UPI0013C3F62F|nr:MULTISPECIES: hypothetical protein [unclassified Rhizobium]
MFPLAMKIVLGGVEFNPILAKIKNCHHFDDGEAMLRHSQAQVSISAAGRRSIQRHAATGIALARGGARRNTKADESEKNGREDWSGEHGCHSLLVRMGTKARTWNERIKPPFYSILFCEAYGRKDPLTHTFMFCS